MERDSFIFYRSFYDAIKLIPENEQLKVYHSICEYAFTGNVPELENGIAKAMFISIKHYIDNQGKRGGFKGVDHSENAVIRNSTDYKKWRKAVFERDDYKCRSCNKKGGVLNAHHIKSFAVFKDLRFDLSNGLTLCKHCHINLHKTEREWQN